MIKITFWREGSANNSSSSHSIIFTKTPLSTDEYSEFGWEFFTAADDESKLNWAILCLHSGWRDTNPLPYQLPNIPAKVLSELSNQQFRVWVDSMGFKVNWNNLFGDDYSYVDHQSIFTFPTYRDVDKGLNLEFAKEFINELLKDEYKVLGGNDNSDSDHRSSGLNEKTTELMKVYSRFQESDRAIAVKDEETGEWIISGSSGLYKFKFEK